MRGPVDDVEMRLSHADGFFLRIKRIKRIKVGSRWQRRPPKPPCLGAGCGRQRRLIIVKEAFR